MKGMKNRQCWKKSSKIENEKKKRKRKKKAWKNKERRKEGRKNEGIWAIAQRSGNPRFRRLSGCHRRPVDLLFAMASLLAAVELEHGTLEVKMTQAKINSSVWHCWGQSIITELVRLNRNICTEKKNKQLQARWSCVVQLSHRAACCRSTWKSSRSAERKRAIVQKKLKESSSGAGEPGSSRLSFCSFQVDRCSRGAVRLRDRSRQWFRPHPLTNLRRSLQVRVEFVASEGRRLLKLACCGKTRTSSKVSATIATNVHNQWPNRMIMIRSVCWVASNPGPYQHRALTSDCFLLFLFFFYWETTTGLMKLWPTHSVPNIFSECAQKERKRDIWRTTSALAHHY